jgi:DNA-binding response OmpR family regulator
MNGLPILLIASQDRASDDVCANVTIKPPFTLRKLLNRIVPLLPGEGQTLLHVGPIRLDMERKQVRCQGGRAADPRLANILKVLKNPGTVLERERLFRDVWNTEYTGDTRTLDVHISWLRRIIEEDPRKPQYLKTVRGVGYRLDV